MALDIFLVTFICLFFLCEVAYLKASLASVLPKGQKEVWLPLWDRVTTMASRWGDRRRHHRRDRGHDARAGGLPARVELRGRARADRRVPRHDPEHRRDDRRVRSLADVARGGGWPRSPTRTSPRGRADAIVETNEQSRIDGLRVAVSILALFALVALLFTRRHPDGTARRASQAQLTTDIAGSRTRAAHASRPALPALPTLVCSGGLLFRDASTVAGYSAVVRAGRLSPRVRSTATMAITR